MTDINIRISDETQQAIYNAHNGINLSRPFNSVEELWEDLNADDQEVL